ncbi:MAG: serine hydrolase, partial [Thermomicrobiales bacterium]
MRREFGTDDGYAHDQGEGTMGSGDRWQGVRKVVALAAAPETRVAVTAIDLETGERFSARGDEPFKAASTIKALILATM